MRVAIPGITGRLTTSRRRFCLSCTLVPPPTYIFTESRVGYRMPKGETREPEDS